MTSVNLAVAALLAISAPLTTAPSSAPVQLSGLKVAPGAEPQLQASGLTPGQIVRMHAIRMFSGWERRPSGGWQQVQKPMYGWADFAARDDGTVRPARQAPLAGTYAGVDAYGLLWSVRAVNSAAPGPFLPVGTDLASMKDGDTSILVTMGGTILDHGMYMLAATPGLRVLDVREGRTNGVYAAPRKGGRYPVLILLHGSEGGDNGAARAMAVRFAGLGYAAFAFNYFAWDLKQLPGVPNAHVNQPIEMLSTVRDWLKHQPEADIGRIGLYGHSKGAEYAEVGAIYLPWVRAVAACVPTDVVWQGYGIGDERNRTNPVVKPPANYSSFSWKGRPLPYVPLDGDRNGYRSNTDFYEAKRRQFPAAARAATIAIEKSHASFLWLAGNRDATWASGAMATRLDARLRASGAAARSELLVYDAAGHAICGDGSYPTRLWEQDSSDPRDPDRDAEGRATVDGWNRIKAFFARTLK